MLRSLCTLATALALAACTSPMPKPSPQAAPLPTTSQPLSWSDVLDFPAPEAGERLAYGSGPQQFGILRLPQRPGPHPVVVLLHGGCWLNQYDLQYFELWAAALAELGYASWNVEYRRLGDSGGGWPGTFTDVGLAIDHLRGLASEYPLNLNDVRVAGHSAGGHLALWAASRAQLPADSPLSAPNPLPLQQVIGLAAITDLARYRIGPPKSCHSSVDRLLEGSPDTQPQRYAQASPMQRLPLGLPISLIQGSEDPIVSASSASAFVDAALAAGDQAQLLLLPGAGHFDSGVPTTASMAAMRRALQQPSATTRPPG